MGTATMPQPAIPDDPGWLDAAYVAALADVRQEMAWWRKKIAADGSGRVDLIMLENRLADIEGVLLDYDRARQDAAMLRSVEQAVARRQAMEAVPEPARPVRRRRRPSARGADGQGELFPVLTPIDGAKTAPALLPLAGIGAWSRHAAAVKLTAGGVAAGFTVATVTAAAVHREPYVLPWPSQPQVNHAQLAPALSVPLDPDAPLLARTFPASYPGKHHKPATVTLTAPSLTVPVPADPAPDPSLSQTSGTSGTSQSSDWSQSPGSSQQDQWSQQDQQDQQGNGDQGGNWQQGNGQHDNGQGGNWQNGQGQGWQQGQHGGWDKGSGHDGGSWQGWQQQGGSMTYRDHGQQGQGQGQGWQHGNGGNGNGGGNGQGH